jgi:hypothetical protein
MSDAHYAYFPSQRSALFSDFVVPPVGGYLQLVQSSIECPVSLLAEISSHVINSITKPSFLEVALLPA